MKLVLFGATGTTGSRVLDELLKAGYNVTAVVRDVSRIGTKHPALTVRGGDVLNPTFVREIIAGMDAVVSTISEGVQIVTHTQSIGNSNIVDAMEALGMKTFVCMGAEGILDAPDGGLFRDHPDYPDLYKPLSYEHSRVQERLQQSNLDWIQVCPPLILPEAADGKYAVQVNVPGTNSGQVNAGNIGHFIARVLQSNEFRRARVGIANLA